MASSGPVYIECLCSSAWPYFLGFFFFFFTAHNFSLKTQHFKDVATLEIRPSPIPGCLCCPGAQTGRHSLFSDSSELIM